MSAESESRALRGAQIVIKSLIVSAGEAVSIAALAKDFRATEGYEIPLRKWGFGSLLEFLRTMPDEVQVSAPSVSLSSPNLFSRLISRRRPDLLLQRRVLGAGQGHELARLACRPNDRRTENSPHVSRPPLQLAEHCPR